MEKTNAMRILDKAKIPYQFYSYPLSEAVSGVEMAQLLGLDPETVYKTLVTVAKSGEHYVFVIPVQEELDLKKAAAAVQEKAVSMVKSKELLPLTGYVHGGCSPVGMKKQFVTVFDETVELLDRIVCSAGKIGCQIELDPRALDAVFPFRTAELT